MKIPFVGSSYKNRSTAVNIQECVNWYLEVYGPVEDAKSQKALMPTPGLKAFSTSTASGAVRGLYTTSTGRMFGVVNNKLMEYNKYGKETLRGTLLTPSGVVRFADNGESIARGRGMILVDGSYGYMLNLIDNYFEQITDPAFPAASHVVFVDGFFIVNKKNTGQVWVSQLYDGLDWGDVLATTGSTTALDVSIGQKTLIVAAGMDVSGSTSVTLVNSEAQMKGTVFSYDDQTGQLIVNITNTKGTGNYSQWLVQVYTGSTGFATAEGSPDNVAALATIHNELYIIGYESTEVWRNYGQPGFPFQRLPGAFINNGTVAPQSIATNGSNLFWLGSSSAGHGQVFMANSYQPTKISSNSIDYEIESMKNIEDAIGWCYTQHGHEFYVVSFERGNRTFCFDLSTGEWHERAWYNPNTGKNERHRAVCQTFAFDRNFVGDRLNQKIYELSLDTFTDDGDIVRRVRTGPHIHNDRKRLYHRKMEIDIERGVGLDGIMDPSTAPDGSDGKVPQAMLTWSDDGGKTWSPEYWKSLGAIGEYKTRLIWHRLGMSRDRIYRLVVSDPIKSVLVDARADISQER